MKVSAQANSKLVVFIETITGLGLRIGLFVFALAAMYLLIVAFGSRVQHLAEMKAADKDDLINNISLVLLALKISGYVVVLSAAIRLFFEETVGVILAVIGGAIYFGVPILFAGYAESHGLVKNTVFASIGEGFRGVGGLCLVAGLVLLVRDVFLRIWRGVSVLRVPKGCDGSQTNTARRKLYERCWDTAFCRPSVRHRCPVFIARKTCWKAGYGCYCDARTITQLSSGGSQAAQGSTNGEQTAAATKPRMHPQLATASCKQCIIYAEHQRQKYRILSFLLLPMIGLLFYGTYDWLSGVIWTFMEKVDRFMSVLAYRPEGSSYSFATDGHILTTMAIIWLAIIVVSYAYKLLDYLIFDLQV